MAHSRLPSQLARLLLAVLAIVSLSTLWLAPLRWITLGAADLGILTSALLAYFIGLLWYRAAPDSWTVAGSVLFALTVAFAVFGTWFSLLVAARAWLPSLLPADSSLPFIATAATVGCFVLLLAPARTAWFATILCALVVPALFVHFLYRQGSLPREQAPTVQSQFIDSSLYRLQLTTYRGWLPVTHKSGGGVSHWGDGVLIANGAGQLAVVRGLDAGGTPAIAPMRYQIPLNSDEFETGARRVLANSPSRYVDVNRFRVADILSVENGESITVYASHHYWNVAGQCYGLRVSALTGERAALEAGTAPAQWRTVFESKPCLTINVVGPRGLPFEGWENGGRIALLNDRELLVTVGDHGFDGVDRLPAVSQDPANSYGKIWRVALDGRAPRLYSLGHRNPQGLMIEANGTVWETEHGPRGGDELNRVVEGGNYGWPLVTLGTDYGSRSWPLDPTPGRHDRFIPPVYAFVPSVGVSNLIAAPDKEFPEWRGDLLVGSLVRQTLFRVRLQNGAVQFAEGIPLGNRLRDMTTTANGALVIWSDDGSFAVLTHRDESAAEKLIATCGGCHTTVSGQASFNGPDLFGVVNRRVASVGDFNYSAALRSLGGRWTPKRLDQFLADPHAMAPGTSMNYGGIPNPQDRRAIIDFLQNRPKD